MATTVQRVDTKYQVFVSSSFRDLREERKAVIAQILAAGHIPAGMELFSAGNTEDFQVIMKAIDQADVFVVLVGSHFGSAADQTRSFTQMEFDYALKSNKPILAFLMEEEQFTKERNEIPTTDELERKHEADLKRFRVDVTGLAEGGSRLVDYFGEARGGTGGLQARFQTALDGLIRDFSGCMRGWVPGYESVLVPLVIYQTEFLGRVLDRLITYDVLSGRCKENAPLKRAMARYFWDQYFAKITNGRIRKLFFESGSTIAYLSSEFSAFLSTLAGQQHLSEWNITTNNVLTYLEFALLTNIRVGIFPYGPPEPRYGATFGEIRLLAEAPAPSVNEPLIPQEKEVVDRIAASMKERGLDLVLATTSGLELSPDSAFRGPHIGSYYNKLFKRAIFTAKLPTVMFLDESKFMLPFKVGYCHAVCDPEMPFDELCRSFPFALCIGCGSKNRREEILETIRPLGFEHVDPEREYSGCWPLVAKNPLFTQFMGACGG